MVLIGAPVLVGFLATLIFGLWGIVVFVALAIALAFVALHTASGALILFLLFFSFPVGVTVMVPGYIAHCVIVERRVESSDQDAP